MRQLPGRTIPADKNAMDGFEVRFGNDVMDTRVCLDPSSLRHVAALRYKAYRSRGFIDENDTGLFVDIYDAFPGTINFGLYEKDRLTATMRACVYWPDRQWLDIPAARKYGEPFARWAATRQVVVEWGRFAMDPEIDGLARARELALLGAVPFLASYFEAPGFVASVRSQHMPFYRRFGYAPVSGPLMAEMLNFESALMVMDWLEHRERLRASRLFGDCFRKMPNMGARPNAELEFFTSRFRR